MRRVIGSMAVAASVLAAASCGGSSSNSGTTTLNWFIFNEPSGGVQEAAKKCSAASHGAYNIKFQYLPSQADAQREQLVRRLGAKVSSLDLLGLDVVWTGEFANAGWVEPVPASTARIVTRNVFPSVLKTAEFKGRLMVVPIWSNTQLLWYRKDLVPNPPKTWDQMIDIGEKLGKAKGHVQVQANRYEGLVVLVNQLIESAGTSVLSGPTSVKLDKGPTEKALQILGRLSHSSVAASNLTTSTEDTARLGF